MVQSKENGIYDVTFWVFQQRGKHIYFNIPILNFVEQISTIAIYCYISGTVRSGDLGGQQKEEFLDLTLF